MNLIIILRGLPGAGKTTLIKELEKQYDQPAFICSADHYFFFGKEHTPENYKFDKSLISKAHGSCIHNFQYALEEKKPFIIVDNTNIKLKDFKKYIRLGHEAGYQILCHAITGISAEESFNLNIHSVPLSTCEDMLKNYKQCPSKIVFEDVVVDVDEIVHNYVGIRQGDFANGKFDQEDNQTGREIQQSTGSNQQDD